MEVYSYHQLLYDFRTETSLPAIAQAALLLSFQCKPHDLQLNTSWLSTAIQYARADECHLYYCLPEITAQQRRAKKRLWWCCILRDRIVALGVRRPVQITPDHFDFTQMPPTEDDFAGEIERSRVYNPGTKTLLARTFILQCQLAIALGTTLMTIYPLNGVTNVDASNTSRPSELLQAKIVESERLLSAWMEKARAHLDHDLESFTTPNKSLRLYADLTLIYY